MGISANGPCEGGRWVAPSGADLATPVVARRDFSKRRAALRVAAGGERAELEGGEEIIELEVRVVLDDLLYELGPGAHLSWDIENLGDELSEVLGRPVDLVSPRRPRAAAR